MNFRHHNLALSLGFFAVLAAAEAGATTFDARGLLSFDAAAAHTESFEGFAPSAEQIAQTTVFEGLDEPTGDGPLHGTGWIRITAGGQSGPFELDVSLPPTNDSYRFRFWLRHGRVSARAIFEYSTEREVEVAYMFPSGRVTSDGWAELVSNPVSVTGAELERGFIRIEGSEIDLDAVEVVTEGDYDGGGACVGAFDPVCGAEAVCLSGFCRQGDRFVPPLPAAVYREQVAKYLQGRLRWLSGGRFTRTQNLPAVLAEMSKMDTAQSAWQFWSSFSRGVRLLRDWHTNASSAISIHESDRHLPVCFIEGDGDLSHGVTPRDPARADVLVSHTAAGSALGLKPGDRLVEVDGQHPIDWARSLIDVNWGYHGANDPAVDADFAEDMRNLLPTFAREFKIIHCDPSTLTCDASPTTYLASDIPVGSGGVGSFGPACDNRPTYHQLNPPQNFGSVEELHFLGFRPWVDEIVESAPGENIWGMTWDSLFGGPGGLTSTFRMANETFKANARGVILDHRTGNGGTIDAPEAVAELVRPPVALSVGPGFMTVAGFDGPETPAEGIALYEKFSQFPMLVFEPGSNSADVDLPVALLIHRDGSASDWLAHGMKGAPNVRIFGPHATVGAFSSFYEYSYWSRLAFRIASGDTITRDGEALIGHGIEPDEVVEHTQTSLLQGEDLPFEAALGWVRSRLK